MCEAAVRWVSIIFSDALQLQRWQKACPAFNILQKQRSVVFMSLEK